MSMSSLRYSIENLLHIRNHLPSTRISDNLWKCFKNIGIRKEPRGKRGGKINSKRIPVLQNRRHLLFTPVNTNKRNREISNCIPIKKLASAAKPIPKFMVLNARSIVKEGAIPSLAADISSNSVDICIITETWLHNQISDNAIALEGFTCIRKDRVDRSGGGVCIYTRNDWKVFKIPQSENDYECLWLKISTGKSYDFYTAALYHPPNSAYNANDLTEFLSNSCDEILTGNPQATVIIAGDINKLNIYPLITQNSLTQMVKTPTRGLNTLDVFVTNHPFLFHRVSTINGLINSDHLTVIVNPKVKEPAVRKYIEMRDVRDQHKITMFNKLNKTDFSVITNCTDVEKAVENLYAIICPLLKSIFPVLKVKMSSRDPIYITPLIKHLLWKRSKLIKCGRYSEANILQPRINTLIHEKRVELVRSNKNGKGSHMWWKMVDVITGRRPKQLPLNTLFEIEDMNIYFKEINTDLDYQPIPCIIIPEDSEVPKLSEHSVLQQLQKIKRTSPGPDGVPYWFWKEYAPQLTTSLCYIFNLSLITHKVPSFWRKANVSPIPKDNPVTSVNQLRPISVTDVIIRVFERLIYNKYIKPVSRKHIGCDQFAFKEGSNTTQALIKSQHKWNEWLDSGADCVRVFTIDFKKAFDMVSHKIVCEKLQRLSMLNPYITKWICDFLSNRIQRVTSNGVHAQWLHINRGVPQGTILGPFLFSVMVNDFRPLYETSELVKYADDTNLAVKVKNGLDNSDEEISNAMDWAEENKMEFNLSKTKELVYKGTRKQKPVPPPISNIERVSVIKSLGVYFSENPDNWDKQFQVMLHKVNTRFHILRTCKNNGYSLVELDYLFQSLILSVITYGIQIWGAANKSYISQVDKVFKRAARCGFTKSILSTETLIKKHDKKIWEKLIKAPDSSQLSDLLPPKRRRSGLRNRKHDFILPKVRTERFKKCFINRCLFL